MAIPLWSSNFPSKSLFYRNASTVEMTWGYSLQHDLNSIRAEHLNHQWETGYIREYIYKRNLCSYLKKEEPEFFMCWHGKYFFFFAGIFLREKSNGQNVSYANIFIKKRKEMNMLNMPKTSLQRYATNKLVTTEGGGTEWLAHKDEDFFSDISLLCYLSFEFIKIYF